MPEMMTKEGEVHFQSSVYLGNICKVGVIHNIPWISNALHHIICFTLQIQNYFYEILRVINDIKHQSMSSVHNYTLPTLFGKNVYTTQIQMKLFNPYSVNLT
jgi:hypothetical protein